MTGEKFTLMQYSVHAILGLIDAEDETKRFAIQDASHLKDKKWIPDISVLFSAGFKQRAFENEYAKNNPEVDLDELSETLTKLKGIANRQIRKLMADLMRNYYESL